MPTVTVRGGFDTFAGEQAPNKTHGGADYLRLSAAASATSYAYVYLKNPVPRGATVASATLTLRVRGNWGVGTKMITARRVADSWKASKLDWNNKPGVTGSSPSVAVVDGEGGDAIEIDVTQHLQTVVNGSAHYGWRIETDSTDADRIHGFGGGDWRHTLTVTWSDKPESPTSLSPDAVVSVSHPVFQYDYGDLHDDELSEQKIQIDPAGNGSSPAFDSGWVATTEPEWDSSTSAWVGLTDGTASKWRVKIRNAGGVESEWSDWTDFSRDIKGTLTIDNPSGTPAFVNEPTPPILATLTGETLSAYQVRITKGDDRTHILYDSGKVKQAGGTIGHTIPFRFDGRRVLRDDREYQVNVRAFDNKDRVATPGDPRFVSEWKTFTMDNDLTIPAPTLTAAQVGVTPWVELTFTRDTAPDEWVVMRDGENIETNIDPADVLVSGTTYVWRDHTASPRDAHTYNVKAIVGGKQSGKSNDATVTTKPAGIWIIDFDRDLEVMVVGEIPDRAAMTDQAATYKPLGGHRPVKITNGMMGLSGEVEGVFVYSEQDVDACEATMWKIKERPDREYQLIYGDLSIPVNLSDITVAPNSATSRFGVVKGVRFRFDQTGDLPFDARI